MKRIGELNQRLAHRPYLYRIELIDRFLSVLDRQQLVFVRPSCWDDPMENIIYNAEMTRHGQSYEHPAKHSIYGQCWSTESDSYALWKIYTAKENSRGTIKRQYGIQLTTELSKLKQFARLNKGVFRFGVVNYLWKYQLEKLPYDTTFIRGLQSTKLNDTHLSTLLVKRKSYAYEQEVRLLAVPDKIHIDKDATHLCRLSINPLDFITAIRIDPTMNEKEVRTLRDRLIDQYGFRSKIISHSSLKRKNPFIFNLD